MVDIGRSVHLSLEAGNKPELMVVLAMMEDPEAIGSATGTKTKNMLRPR